MAMMMALSRNIPQATASLKAGEWERGQVHGCWNYTARLWALLAWGAWVSKWRDARMRFGMTLLGADPFLSDDLARQLHIQQASYDEIFDRSDYITLHAAFTDQTHHLISASALARCKDGVRIINCARGRACG